VEYSEKLKEMFINHQAKVGIIGMGYVGYPMAYLSASRGFKVIGLELNEERVDMINRGESYIQDVSGEEASEMVQKGLLSATTDYSEMQNVQVIMITVPTPLNKTGDPDMGYVFSVLDMLTPHLHSGMLIVLESTTYPGTTEEIFPPVVVEAGFEIGKDIFIAFSPERIDPGNIDYGPRNTPKVIGGITETCTEVAMAFYEQIIDTPVAVNSTTAAEMVKLYENTFRAINIGLVNELAIICHLLKVDVWEIIEAASSKPFGFTPFYPGPGLGGHCIPVDPSYLAWKMRALEYKTRFIDLATEVNTGMPVWVVDRVVELLNEEGKPVKNSKILLLGLAYKAGIDDLRESPALDVFRLLQHRGGIVCYHDPFCPSVQIDEETVLSMDLNSDVIKKQDMVIITTGHSNVDYKLVVDHSKMIFDTRNVIRSFEGKGKAKIHFL